MPSCPTMFSLSLRILKTWNCLRNFSHTLLTLNNPKEEGYSHIVFYCINSLPNNKFSDKSSLKAFADDKLTVAKKSTFALGRVENIVGKEENAVYQHFLLFPQCFQKASPRGSLKVTIVWKRVNPFPNDKF